LCKRSEKGVIAKTGIDCKIDRRRIEAKTRRGLTGLHSRGLLRFPQEGGGKKPPGKNRKLKKRDRKKKKEENKKDSKTITSCGWGKTKTKTS